MASAPRNLASGVAAAVLLFCGAGVAAGPARAPSLAKAKPMHIMSMSMCTDLLLLQLAPRSRIASVTFLAHDGVKTLFPGADDGLRVNWGTSEDAINQKPDLILDRDYAIPTTLRRAAAILGAPLIEVKSANSFADIRTAIRQVGDAVGEPVRAELLIRKMDSTLARIRINPLPRRLRVVAWSGGGSVPGKGTLTNAIIEAAGAVNIAAGSSAEEASFGIEQLLQADPDALLYGGAYLGKPSLRADEGQHRLVRDVYGPRRIAYDDIPYTCGLPQSADSARDIHNALLALPAKRPLH